MKTIVIQHTHIPGRMKETMNLTPKITVFVPTYNRETLIKRLYHSLLEQKFTDFEFLIIDDGSTDNTKQLVDEWIKENIIQIRYYHQNNQGKHFAYNKAIKEAKGELFIDIDSDDYLLKGALQIIHDHWELIKNDNSLVGMQFLCADENGKTIGSPFKKDTRNSFELRYIDKITGDKAIVYKTSKLKQHSLPEIKGEIVPESILHNRVSAGFNYKCFNEHLTIKQYLVAGLTNCKKDISTFINSRITLYNEMNYFKPPFNLYVFVNSRYVKYSLHNKGEYSNIIKNAINKRYYFFIPCLLGSISYFKASCLKKQVN